MVLKLGLGNFFPAFFAKFSFLKMKPDISSPAKKSDGDKCGGLKCFSGEILKANESF